MPQFFFNDKLKINQSFVLDDNTRHLKDVRRIKINDLVDVRDNEGNLYESRVVTIDENGILLIAENEIELELKNRQIDLTLGLCLLKNKNFDLALQKAVEIGVNRIIPVISERTIVKLKKDDSSKIERYKKIVSEASKQSYRSKVPELGQPCHINDFISDFDDYEKIISVTDENSCSIRSVITSVKKEKIVVLIGPEGGFSAVETKNAEKYGWNPVYYGYSVMRAETAAIVIPSIIINEMLEKKNEVL